MRAFRVLGVLSVFCSAAAMAQTPPPAAPSAAPPAAAAPAAPSAPGTGRTRGGGGDISKDEYIQRAVERAKHNAETRFDKMDTNHDGILTADERRAARAARRGGTAQSQ